MDQMNNEDRDELLRLREFALQVQKVEDEKIKANRIALEKEYKRTKDLKELSLLRGRNLQGDFIMFQTPGQVKDIICKVASYMGKKYSTFEADRSKFAEWLNASERDSTLIMSDWRKADITYKSFKEDEQRIEDLKLAAESKKEEDNRPVNKLALGLVGIIVIILFIIIWQSIRQIENQPTSRFNQYITNK